MNSQTSSASAASSATRTPFIGGNWKMHGTLASAQELSRGLVALLGDDEAIEIGIYPPMPHLQAVARICGSTSIGVGAQDVSPESQGAFTGDTSAAMIQDVGGRGTLVGHSERRHGHGESDELVGRKLRRALQSGLHVVLCIGETQEERDAGATDAVNERQLRAALEGVEGGGLGRIVVAYEPVWAIGTGRTATPEDAHEAHSAIRAVLGNLYDARLADSTRIIYGGSVKPANAAELFTSDQVDGGLIGGASLVVDDFAAICGAAGATVATS